MATSNDKSTAEGESNTPPIPVPREHKALDYLLSQIPKKAQKGMLVQCDLDLLCVDADSEYIVLGSNVGTLFLYSRKREVMERLKTNSHNDLITAVRLHHGLEHQVVAGTSKGIVYIYQLPSSLPGQNKRLQMFVVKDMHKHKITCCVWSLNGMKVFTGDDSGVVVSTEFDAYQGQCKSSVTLVERDSQIIQLHHAHKALLVSTNHRSFIFRPDADDHIIQVGQKERKIVGDFGACFIPAMCKPDDAQLYASRPGMRVWKAGMDGRVINTYLFRELLVKEHPEMPILFYEGIIPTAKPENQFGPLYMLEDKYLVTYNDTCLYMINPEDNVVIGSQSKLGHITDVAVTNNEIFILRKNTNRNLIRIGMYPEGRGDSLYHRLIQEKEKFGLHPPPDSPSPGIQDTKHGSHSPLHFIQTNILDKIAGPSHKSKPVENLISNLESMNLELNSEAADHEIDHSEIDTSSINKETNQSMEDLPPVVKLASPDLLTVEIFGENSSQTKSSTNQRPERVNPFLRDGNIDDVQKEDNDSGYDRNNSLESSQKSLTDTGSFGVMEERLQNINVTEDASDDIVFTSKPKKHKKKRKGFKTPDIGDFSMERSSSDKSLHLSADRGITTPDSVSIASVTSETSEDSATSDNQRQSMPEADRAGAINSTISVDAPSVETGDQSFEKEVSGKKSEVGISEDTAQESKDSLIPDSVLEDINQKVSKKQEEKTHGPKNLKHRDKFERIEKQLHEFEKSLPEELVPEDLSRSFGKNVKKAESGPTDSQKQARKTENENSEDVSCKDSHVTSSQKSLRRQESSEPSIYSIYRSPDSKAEFFASPEYQSPTSPSSTGTSSTEDFYQKYSSSSYSLSSLTGTAEHPLTKRKEEDEDDSHSEDKLESIQVSEPSEEIPSQKLINNWSDIYTPANVTSLALTNSHVWYTDKNSNIYHCSIFSGGLQWVRASGQARQISVSRSGHIVWRLHGNKAFAGSRITSKNPEGMKWLDAVKEVQYISVDDTCAWYIKQNNEVMLQKGLSKDRPCFKSQNVVCPYVLKQVVCKSGVVWALTDQCRLVYRTGITKKCPEGTDWAEYECSSTAEDFLFNSVTLGDGNVGWALDVVGRIWFMTDVTMETPIGDSHWWQVPVSEILVQDVTAIDTLRLLAKKFDPQKLADLMKSQQEGLIAAGRGGVWVCPDSKNTIRVCRSTVEGHLWEESLLVGIASSACWKLISATGCYGQSGIVWATQPNGDIFTFSPSSDKCSTVKRPVNKGLYVSLSASQNTVWILTDESKVYIRTGISARDPQGVDWYDLDMSQLGDVLMVSVACSTHNVWAVDSDGMVYQRIGVNAPSSYSLNPAWLPVDTSNVGNNFIQIAAGPKDYMVWAVDNRKQVYTRLGITEEMPIGENWIHIPGTPASQLIVTEKHVWALNPNGEILCRYGITPKNPGGDYWRKIPGVFTLISASRSDELWGLSREGQIFHRKTKYLLRRQTNFKESPNPKVSGSQSGEEGWELV